MNPVWNDEHACEPHSLNKQRRKMTQQINQTALSIQDEVPEFSQADPGIDTGSNKRLPAVLLVDNSGSMQGSPIRAVNDGLDVFREELLRDKVAAEVVEVALVTFGGTVDGVQNFTDPDGFRPPALHASGGTPMGEAIMLGAELIEERRKALEAQGISLLRPWIWLVTDGKPTDNTKRAERMIERGESNDRFLFFAVGTESADFGALQQISVRAPVRLSGLDFRGMFKFLSESLSQGSRSRPGDQLPLSRPDGWGTIIT